MAPVCRARPGADDHDRHNLPEVMAKPDPGGHNHPEVVPTGKGQGVPLWWLLRVGVTLERANPLEERMNTAKLIAWLVLPLVALVVLGVVAIKLVSALFG